jgi:DNA-binding transcriptional LysR family regulator
MTLEQTSVPEPSLGDQYFDPQGKPTIEGQELLQRLYEAVRELQAAAQSHETTIQDHETRIEALEP